MQSDEKSTSKEEGRYSIGFSPRKVKRNENDTIRHGSHQEMRSLRLTLVPSFNTWPGLSQNHLFGMEKEGTNNRLAVVFFPEEIEEVCTYL